MDIAELTRRILDRRPTPQAPLRIMQAGHPSLRHETVAVQDRLDPQLLAQLVDAMVITMREAPGVGLAAPQIGLPLQLIVVEDRYAAEPGEDADDDLHERRPLPLRTLLGPRVDPLGDEDVFAYEGCLSVDGWQSIVPRSRRVRLRAQELLPGGTLREVDEEHIGWTARILQHEVDHLHTTLCHDRMVPRSYIDVDYISHYEDLSEAIRRLGLTGDITRLGPGEVVLRRESSPAAQD